MAKQDREFREKHLEALELSLYQSRRMQVRHGIESAAGENTVVELFFHGKGIWMGLVVCLVGF